MNRMARLVPVIAALAVGCGDPSGLRAQGNVALTIHQAGQADGTAGLALPADTYIDPPPGLGRGFFGTCTRTGSRWTVDIARGDTVPTGLRRVVFTVSEGAAAGGATAKFTLGDTEYNGAAECTATAAANVDKGVELTARCTNLRSSADPRTVDATVTLSLVRCEIR
jgi:hypothetical protein